MPWLVTVGSPLPSAPLFVLAFIGLSLALGRRILICFKAPSTALLERGALAIALGAGALQFLPLLLGALGLLKPRWLGLAAVLLAAALYADLAAVAKRAWSALARARLARDWRVMWLLALLPGLGALAMQALSPTIDPDGLGYHLTVPKRWLATGTLAYLPTYPNSNMPMGAEMLFCVALALSGDVAAKLLHFSLGLTGALASYCAGARLRGAWAGAVAVALYLFGPVGLRHVLGAAYVEGVCALAVTASVLAFTLWLPNRDIAWLRVCFLLSGTAVAFKTTAGLFPFGLAAMTWLLERDGTSLHRAGSISVSRALGLAPLVLLPLAPWLLRAWVMTGNPLFPTFARWIPSRDLSPDLAHRWEYFNRYLNWATSIGADWSIERRKETLALMALGLILSVLLIRGRLRAAFTRNASLVLLALALLQLGLVGLYVRYWIPLLAALQLPLIAALPRVRARAWMPGVLVAGTALLSTTHAIRWVRDAETDPRGVARVVFGLEQPRTFLQRHLPLYDLHQWINRNLPGDARIALSFTCAAFHIDRKTYCLDIVQGGLRLTSWSAFLLDVQGLGITHVLAPTALSRGELSPPIDHASVAVMVRGQEDALVRRLLREHGQLLATGADQGLYKLRLPLADGILGSNAESSRLLGATGP